MQATLDSTVCVSGYSAKIRPPVSYTNFIKKEMLRYDKLSAGSYQLDHLISISLGGSVYDSRNLFMQPQAQARVDDAMENRLHRDLCAGKLTLRQAQRAELAWKRIQG